MTTGAGMMETVTSVTKVFRFSAGHRLLGHEGLCAHLHGHNYRVEVTVTRNGTRDLDALGRVVDFALLKDVIDGWLRDSWDHAFLLCVDDWAARGALTTFSENSGVKQRVWLMAENPTAENMGRVLFKTAVGLLEPFGVGVLSVVVWETDTCSAEVTA